MRHWNVWIAAGFLIVSFSFFAVAQGISISGPSLGFISDESGTRIWPLLGILGATVPGEALTLPENVTRTTLSPRHNYALAIATANGQPLIINFETADFAMVPLTGGRSNPVVIAISPTGTAAALYERESRVLQLVSGLPASAGVVSEFDASVFAGEVRDIAVSDDAKLALVIVGDETRTLWLIDANGTASPVSVTQPSRMIFVPQRADALIADDATHEVFLLQSLDENPVRQPGVALREDGHAVSAVGVSADGQTIFVAQEGSEDISITDLQTRITAIVSCHCSPTMFAPLKGTSLFRLNNPGNGPVTVLDASSSTPRTLIIPIDPALLARRDGEQ
jgi:DNA-binding beta-propeller fold protein YncE